ncbi:hypothetical protein Q31b_12170 [Novipirellula aureliae]|uniref:HNH domain-containing protein n=1 Tax=Novipirellula aureliae TaxID=2527966 RepID=A0A5C6EFM0_9BACT|nr:hypothetical protein [Novipirellula aureliae]TWU46039.1 hypothetical protein Q31b_12170 [Novipirellula aureliae]
MPHLPLRACQLCGRVTRRGTTEHHLIPRMCHSNKWFKKRFTREQMRETISVCRDCHVSIHKLIPSEKELGRDFHSIEALLSHEQLANFVSWVRRRK